MNETKISLSNVRVAKINARIFDESEACIPDGNFKRKTTINLEPIDEFNYLLTVGEILNFEPCGPFELELETIAKVESSGPLPKDNKEVERKVAELIMGANTLTIAFITERMLSGPPIIIPPFLEDIEEILEE